MSAVKAAAKTKTKTARAARVACRTCKDGQVEEVVDLGWMPIANGLLRREDLSKEEFFFRLAAGVCPKCWMMQLMETVPPRQLFHENYVYFSSTSQRMKEHFAAFGQEIVRRLGKQDKPQQAFIVEVGSNDGIMLEPLRRQGARVLGIEPSSNVAEVARQKGVETWTEFFSPSVAEKIVKKHGRADALLGANVICHIPDLHAFLEGVDRLLAEDGIFVFEDPSLLEILKTTAYDQIYDEHVFYFSVTALANLLALHGMKIFDVQPQQVHGGSNRIFACRKSCKRYDGSGRVKEALEEEKRYGISSKASYEAFAGAVRRSRTDLTAQLKRLKAQGRRIIGYGATSKGNVVLNYCQIGPETLEYITDTTPIKQGCFSPGMRIPIVKPDVFYDNPPDYAVLLAWNHAAEILRKEEAFCKSGGHFITHIPTVRILGNGS